VPSIGVVTDSTADFPEGVQERLGIVVVPLTVQWDGDTFRDKVDLATGDFYRMLRERSSLPKTAAPAPGQFEQAYEELLGRVDHVISIHISGRLSGTVDVARGAAERVGSGRVTVVDSLQTTLCQGWLAVRAAELGAEGVAAEQAVTELRSLAPRLRVYFVLDTLEYVHKGGRIGRAQVMLGSLLNIKPMLTFRDGEVHPVERVRSRTAAMRRLVDVVATQGRIERLGVLHGGSPETLVELERLVAERLPDRPIDRTEIGSVLGTYAGPGAFGVCCVLADG
jgi:DegV family protein with EDD domain